jgi:hypothetical protein
MSDCTCNGDKKNPCTHCFWIYAFTKASVKDVEKALGKSNSNENNICIVSSNGVGYSGSVSRDSSNLNIQSQGYRCSQNPLRLQQ